MPSGVIERWLPSGADTAPLPPPDPEDLAWEAIASIGLQPIQMGTAPRPLSQDPESLGAVGMPVWLWAENSGPGVTAPVSSSASERGFTVTISARLDSIVWDLGDGSEPIECGVGTAFDPRTMDRTTPVDCGRQLGYQREGEYTITATSNWVVDWQGIGESGTIRYPREASERVRIGELQVLVVHR